MCRPLLLLALAAALGATPARADDDLISQIEAVSLQLRSQPGAAELYVKRADLLRRWGRLEASLADARQAERLDPELATSLLARARTLRDAGHRFRSLAAFERFLRAQPDHRPARLNLANLLAGLGRPRSAAAHYDQVLEATQRPEPDLFLARHDLMLEAGRPREALAGLQEALQRLGPLVSLELPALALEQDLGQVAEGLARLDRLAAAIPRMDGWALHRARFLRAAGRLDEARLSYGLALSQLGTLSPRRRGTRSAESMRQEALAGLAELAVERPEAQGDGSEAKPDPKQAPKPKKGGQERP